MPTEDRRALIDKLEAKRLALDAKDGRDVLLAEEVDSIYNELYPDDADDEDTCVSCGVTFVEMDDFDDYQNIRSTGHCQSCATSRGLRLMPPVPERWQCKNCGAADVGKLLLIDFEGDFRCPECCSSELVTVLGTTAPTDVQLSPSVGARARADSYDFEVEFDAAPWFKGASDEEIAGLIACDWGGSEEADRVARDLEESYRDLRRFFWFLGMTQDGYEVYVNKEQALLWLSAHRPELLMRLTSNDDECPLCRCGTVEHVDHGDGVVINCRGECGASVPLEELS